jgi:Trp operon repressor
MDISRLARKISRGEFRDNAVEKQQLRPDFNQRVAINSRKRSKRRGPLTTSEKVDIVHRVLISYEMHAEVAREYRVTPQVIAHLMMKAKKNKQFLHELLVERDEVANRRDVIQSHVEELNGKREVIDSAAHVIKSLTKEHMIKTTEQEVRDVMRQELGMRYRKIKQVSLHSNSEKNLVLR